MKELSIKQLDDINDVKEFLKFLSVSLNAFELSLDELDVNALKSALGLMHLMIYDEIKKLEIK